MLALVNSWFVKVCRPLRLLIACGYFRYPCFALREMRLGHEGKVKH